MVRMSKVSIIVPVHNAAPWLNECFHSIELQTYRNIQVSIFEDLSSDSSWDIICEWECKFKQNSIEVICSRNSAINGKGRGCGFAKNRAVEQSDGEYLCFLDADDVMESNRIELQLTHAEKLSWNTIVGSKISRIPEDATPRLTAWYNSITEEQLYSQQFKEVTLAMPTWFMSRRCFDEVGGFDETFTPKTPEDMIFFYKLLSADGKLFRVPEPLVRYRYNPNSASYAIHRFSLISRRLQQFEARILCNLSSLTIWSAGRDGKKIFQFMSQQSRNKIAAFCDVDINKIGNVIVDLCTNRKIPIIHFSQAIPPLIICVATDRTDGILETNIASMKWIEGKDYWHLI